MKRIWLLMSMALMFAAAMALSGVARAKPVANGKADAKCLAEAIRTLQPGFKPSGYHFVGGTAGEDLFDRAATAGPDVLCGFGGNDSKSTLDEGDLFLGGAGQDTVDTNSGTFDGGDGTDTAFGNIGILINVEQGDV